MWEEFQGKPVKLVQLDNWTKHGIFLGEKNGFVSLRYVDGRVVFVAVSHIASLSPEVA